MKDLTKLTDAELVEAYKKVQEYEEADRLMGNYGFDAEVSNSWEQTYNSFEEEFEKRGIMIDEPSTF